MVAPFGTVVAICVSEFTVKVAEVPLKVSFVACVNPVPLMVTEVPIGPLAGATLVIVGLTWKVCVLVRMVNAVVTVTGPVSAPAGTVALMKVLPVSFYRISEWLASDIQEDEWRRYG